MTQEKISKGCLRVRISVTHPVSVYAMQPADDNVTLEAQWPLASKNILIETWQWRGAVDALLAVENVNVIRVGNVRNCWLSHPMN